MVGPQEQGGRRQGGVYGDRVELITKQEHPAARKVLTRECGIGNVLGQAGEGEAHMGQSAKTPRLSELADAGRRRANANRWL